MKQHSDLLTTKRLNRTKQVHKKIRRRVHFARRYPVKAFNLAAVTRFDLWLIAGTNLRSCEQLFESQVSTGLNQPSTMNLESFTQSEYSGARITVPFLNLKRLGPRHHAIVIGVSKLDQEIWIAELSRSHGYRMVAWEQWLADNKAFADQILIQTNPGPRSNWEVACSAVEEIAKANKTGWKYHIFFNNCESFADRHVTGHSRLSPQVQTTIKAVGCAIAGGALLFNRYLERKAGKSTF